MVAPNSGYDQSNPNVLGAKLFPHFAIFLGQVKTFDSKEKKNHKDTGSVHIWLIKVVLIHF